MRLNKKKLSGKAAFCYIGLLSAVVLSASGCGSTATPGDGGTLRDAQEADGTKSAEETGSTTAAEDEGESEEQIDGLNLCGIDSGEPGDPACRMQMIDSMNDIETVLQVVHMEELGYIVENGIGSDTLLEVEVKITDGGVIETNVGAPKIGCAEMKTDYQMSDSEQLVFSEIEGHPCSDFEMSLIFFLVMEWFYFG